MPKIAKGGISRAAIEETQQLIRKPRAKVREEKKPGAEFPGHNKAKAVIERHPAMFAKIKRTAAFLANMALQNIQRHARGAKARVHLYQHGRHRSPNRHLCHLMTMRGPKQQVCHPHMCIYILRFPMSDFWQGSHAR
jgi:hypothetical protein